MIHSILFTVPFFVAIAMFAVMQYFKLLPSIQGIHAVADILNTKGGIILVLASMSLFFFLIAIKFTYFITMLLVNKQLSPENTLTVSIVNGAMNFMDGVAFMGAFSAMLNAMKGEPPVTTVTTVTPDTSVAKVEVPKTPTQG